MSRGGLTLEMVSGVLKSRPPIRRKPHGEGPFSVTVWLMVLPAAAAAAAGGNGAAIPSA